MALDAVKKAGVKLQIGFVRRFDHNHRGVYDAVRSGKIGTPHILRISSRDPQPPTIAYVRRSGGIFYDMMIHDFDMIRFLAGCEVTEVYAKGAVLVDPAIGAEGDVDTAIVTLTFENGAIGVIDNSVRQYTAMTSVWKYSVRKALYRMKTTSRTQLLFPVQTSAAANKSLKEGRPVKISEVDV